MDASKGKSRKGVTFKLVSASYSDPRVVDNPSQRTLVLKESQNDRWKKRDKSTIPKAFLDLINPADFGIHDKLPEQQKIELVNDIYGSQEEYERIALKFAHVNAPKKPKEEDLDDDCYFPKDGYDYSQHLATITPQNFIPAVKKPAEDDTNGAVADTSKDFPSLQEAGKEASSKEDPELAELLKALDEDSSEMEEMDDDFVAKAMDNEDPDTFVDENELLWGGYKPLKRVMFESNQLFGADVDEYEASRGRGGVVDQEPDSDEGHCGNYGGDGDEDEVIEEDVPQSLLEMLKHEAWMNDENEKDTMDVLDPEGDMNEAILQLVEQAGDTDDSADDIYEESSDESEQWDVQTILTKYTNATNYPQRIRANVIQKAKEIEKRECSPSDEKVPEGVEYLELPPVVTTRNRNETPEERRARKAAVKQAKAFITRMKKENKQSLKDAKKKVTENNSRGSYDIVNGVKYIKLK